MPIKSVCMNENFKKQTKMCFFLMSQGSFNPKNQVPRSKGVPCSLFTDRHTDRHTHTHTIVNTGDTLSEFHNFSFNLMIIISPLLTKMGPNKKGGMPCYLNYGYLHLLRFSTACTVNSFSYLETHSFTRFHQHALPRTQAQCSTF